MIITICTNLLEISSSKNAIDRACLVLHIFKPTMLRMNEYKIHDTLVSIVRYKMKRN